MERTRLEAAYPVSMIISPRMELESATFINTHNFKHSSEAYCSACKREMLYVGGLTTAARAPCVEFVLPATLIICSATMMLCIASSTYGSGSAITCDASIVSVEARSHDRAAERELLHILT